MADARYRWISTGAEEQAESNRERPRPVPAGDEAELLDAYSRAVIGVVDRRQTMPILANVLLAAKGGQLAVTATDLEVELVASAQVDVQRAGEVTVPGRKLLDICRALPEGSEITIALEGERLLLRARRSRFTLSTLPAAEFPTAYDAWEAAFELYRARVIL